VNIRIARTAAPIVVLVAALALAGCGSSGGSPSGGGSASSASNDTGGVTVSGDAGAKPTVTVSAATAAVTKLVTSDVTVGTGAEATPGSTVTAQYVGIGAISGKQFDSSWDRGQPAQFPLANVIKGWQDGIPGMKVGGRRILVIPGDQAYGANPPPGSGIAANEPLVFVVDLVSVP